MAMIRTVRFQGIVDDLKREAEKLKQQQLDLIDELAKKAEKKAEEIASKESKTAAETHAKTITKELRPYLIGTVAIVGVVGALVAYGALR